jgi:[NiFe] hydrogenase diaphorase moiety large subunit
LLTGYLDKLSNGYGSKPDLAEIETLNRVLKSTSHCGLGQAAANPILDGLKKFRPAYDRRMLHHDFEPAFNLDAALERARQITGRNDAGAHILEEHE